MNKIKGFLLAESILALFIAFLGVISLSLIAGEGQANEREIELKTNRAYAWHVMRKNNLQEIKVHDQVYQLTGNREIYDTQKKQFYQINR